MLTPVLPVLRVQRVQRRRGGIHFQTDDMDGRALGKVVGYDDWNKALTFFNGTATAPA